MWWLLTRLSTYYISMHYAQSIDSHLPLFPKKYEVAKAPGLGSSEGGLGKRKISHHTLVRIG